MDTQPRFHLWYFAFAALAILLFQDWWQERYGMAVIPYSEFEQRLDHGGIAEIDIAQDAIYGTFSQPVNGKSTFMTVRVDPVLADKLQGHNVRFAGVRESTARLIAIHGLEGRAANYPDRVRAALPIATTARHLGS